MKRMILAAAVVMAAAAPVLASGAFAGEYNPARGYIFSPPNATAGAHSNVLTQPNTDEAVGPANSICSFSGRDDTDTGDNAMWAASPAGGRVQSPGQVTASGGGAPLAGTGCGPESGAGG